MLVVSNIDLTVKVPMMEPSRFLESNIKDTTLNINNDYRYMKTGYYVSLHAEILGNKVIPSSEDIIDSSRTPILLLRASKAKIPTMPFLVTDSVKKIIAELHFPVVVFAVNPFIHEGYKTAANKSALYRTMKSLGMNYKFSICALPLKGEMVSVKSFFGKCPQGNLEIQNLANKVYALFKIPVCKLHIQMVDGKAFLCGLQALEGNEMLKSDLDLISKEILLISQQGEHFSA